MRFTLLLLLIFNTVCNAQKDKMIDLRDGKTYKTIKIGSQTWMAENLHFNDSTLLFHCFNDSSIDCRKYGPLYTWEAAQKVCPVGWHLPSKVDFDSLFNRMGDKRHAYNMLIDRGDSGFDVLLGGYFAYYGASLGYREVERGASFWTSTDKWYSAMQKWADGRQGTKSLANCVRFTKN